MNRLVFFGLIFFLTLSVKAQKANAIIGQWKDDDNPDKKIEMYATAKSFFGKGINDDSKKNKLVFKDLVYQEKDNLYRGILINPGNGDEINITIKMVNIDRFEFTVRKFFVTRTFHFVRIK